MAKNTIQFQKGLSLTEFLEKYGTEEQCRNALFKLRWADGFICPSCGNGTCCEIKSRKVYQCHRCHTQTSLTSGTIFSGTKIPLTKWFLAVYLLTQRKKSISALQSRKVYQCHRCHTQTSLTSGTIFSGTKIPLTKWFLAVYLLTQRKKSISALQLKREIGVSYNTAWKVKHKLMRVMLERESEKVLDGRIEIDDAYLGGRREGKPGRGAAHKVPFVAVVETDEESRPRRVQLRTVKSFTSKEIESYAKRSLSSSCNVVSDGLQCFRAVKTAGCGHEVIVCGGGKKAVKETSFKWENTLLGNVKNSMTGTFHSIGLKHASRYLAEFEYRFNRRYRLDEMIERLLYVGIQTPPMPYRLLRMAESSR